MGDLHKAHPHYGWDSNQGYGTKAHRLGLASHGITPHHRTSFAPIKKHLS
jgi:ribonuclease HII